MFSNDGTTVLQLAPRTGYFFTDALEAGVELNGTSVEGAGDSGTIGPFLAYHFARRGAKALPFPQAQIATRFTDDVVFGGAAGVKYFFLPGGALRAQLFGFTGGASIFL